MSEDIAKWLKKSVTNKMSFKELEQDFLSPSKLRNIDIGTAISILVKRQGIIFLYLMKLRKKDETS